MGMKEIIAKNISSYLNLQNKKQTDLAVAIGIPRQTICKMLNGTRMISAPELCKIAQFLNVSMDDLVQKRDGITYSPLIAFMGYVKTETGKEGIKMAEKLIDIYSFHYKFQSQDFLDKCNKVWIDE